MEFIQIFFNVKTTCCKIFSYPMSYIELFGTIFYLLSVWLIAQKNMLTWPLGLVSVILYGILFYQIQLYSDTIEQIYYFGACIYGWIYWKKNDEQQKKSINFRYSSHRHILIWGIISFVFSCLLAVFMKDIHNLFPRIFPTPASFPFIDALTTIMSFVAMFLMAQKRIESWIYWIMVDVIGIILYFIKDVKFISLLYVMLLAIAVRGFFKWHKESNSLRSIFQNYD